LRKFVVLLSQFVFYLGRFEHRARTEPTASGETKCSSDPALGRATSSAAGDPAFVEQFGERGTAFVFGSSGPILVGSDRFSYLGIIFWRDYSLRILHWTWPTFEGCGDVRFREKKNKTNKTNQM